MLKIAYHPIYKHPLPEGHRFPMMKYELLPQQLIHEGTCTEANFFEPEIPNDKHIVAVHDPEYFYDLLNMATSVKLCLATSIFNSVRDIITFFLLSHIYIL